MLDPLMTSSGSTARSLWLRAGPCGCFRLMVVLPSSACPASILSRRGSAHVAFGLTSGVSTGPSAGPAPPSRLLVPTALGFALGLDRLRGRRTPEPRHGSEPRGRRMDVLRRVRAVHLGRHDAVPHVAGRAPRAGARAPSTAGRGGRGPAPPTGRPRRSSSSARWSSTSPRCVPRSLAAGTGAATGQQVWRPDAIGSVLFLVSSAIALAPEVRRRRHDHVRTRSWAIAALNMLGSVFFGLSAIGAWTVPSTGAWSRCRWPTPAPCSVPCASWPAPCC